MTRILLIVLALGAIVAMVLLFNRPGAATVERAAGSTLPAGDATVLVQGWSEGEVIKIVADFERGYGLPQGTLPAVRKTARVIEIVNARPISSEMLLYLVNYLHYPRDFNLQDRNLAVVARARLTEAMGSPRSLLGGEAEFYVPEKDIRFDEVYARVGEDKFFRVSFTRLEWEPVEDGRVPTAIRELSKSTI